jgi:predicted acyltransferase (DUF342 family)
MTFAFLFFFGLVTALAVLPLLPAILEWRRPTDTAPLRVVQHSDVDIRYLANRFRTRVGEYLSEPLARCRETGAVQNGSLDGADCRVVPNAGTPFLTDAEAEARRLDHVLLGCGDLRLSDGLTVAKELYAEGSVTGGANGVYRAILATGDVVLGPGSRTLRWVHADGTVHLGANSRAHGRVSADHLITLAPGAEFERLRARRIEFGRIEMEPHWPAPRERPRLKPEELRQGRVVEVEAGRWLVKGDCEVPSGVYVDVDLVVTGMCSIGQGSELAGSVKSHEDLVLEDEVEVRGAVVAGRDLQVGARCRIEGPIVAERVLRVDREVVVGDPDRPTTLSALDTEVAVGTVIHGTVWAHRRGLVTSPIGAAAVPGGEAST